MHAEGAARRLERQPLAAWLFSAPALLLLLVFVLLPFTLAVGLSFTDYRLNSPLATRWIGLDNYRRCFGAAGFLQALGNNLYFAAVVVPVQTMLALALALLLDRRLRGMLLFRTLFFMPVVYPMALVAVVWLLIYAPDGLLLQALHGIGVDYHGRLLDDPLLALPAIMLLSIWQGVGFQTVILLAGLQQVPDEVYEAAAIDGAGRFRRFWHVTLPMLRNPLIMTALITTILSFRLFDQVQILTPDGGPDGSTRTMMFVAVRNATQANNIGLASAMTVLFFLVVCAVAIAQHLLFRQRRELC